jgi:hypothetical protein
MGQQLTGVHIFEKLGPIEWEDELIAIQAISALSWKKFHGRVELYCNEEHLESLKKWGIDKIYDKINTSLLSNAPKNIDRNEYWTFCKIFVSANLKPPFVLVDTDLWITDELHFDNTKSFVAYHEENYDWSRPYNFYVNFDNFVPEKYINYFDLNVKPTNVALLFWNDEELLKSWYDIVYEILNENRKCELSKLQKMTFLEQWLLPMNAVKTNKEYGVLIPQLYNSFFSSDPFHPNLWSPPVEKWGPDNWLTFNKIKHVWGLKKSFHILKIIRGVFETLYKTTKEYNLEEEYFLNIIKFIEKKIGVINPSKKLNSNTLKVMYFIPNIITDSNSNLLFKRIKYIYESNYDIELFVTTLPNKNKKDNIFLKEKIINFIGSKNYFEIGRTYEETLKIINDKKIDICHYENSLYDGDFNNIMNLIYLDNNIKTIKSFDGINLESNNLIKKTIDYPLVNNVIHHIPDINYKFDKNKLPLHVKLQNKIMYGGELHDKNILCFVDDTFMTDSMLFEIITNINETNLDINFHFLNFLNVENPQDNDIIKKLSHRTKIWLENVDFYTFILFSDLVLDFTTSNNTLSLECISYGIPILKPNEENKLNDFFYEIPKNTNKMLYKIKNILYNDNKRIIPSNIVCFGDLYYKYYLSVKNK